MAVRLIPCRHTETGAEVDIPETALQHLRAYEPVDDADRERLGYTDQATNATGEPSPADDTTSSKPATSAAKKTKESTRHGD